MGRAVVHFEIEGLRSEELRRFYGSMFGWNPTVVPNNPADYSLIAREENVNAEGVGIGGALSAVPEEPSNTWTGPTREEGYRGHVTVFVEVPDVAEALREAVRLGGTRMQGPDPVMPGVEMGKFTDPEGHLIGVITAA